MSALPSPDTESQLNEFITSYVDEEKNMKYERALSSMVVNSQKSIVVDFMDLYNFKISLATTLLNDPNNVLPAFQRAFFYKLAMRNREYADLLKEVKVRIKNVPHEIPIREIRAQYIGNLIMFTGIILSATKTQPLITAACFRCIGCGESLVVDQEEQFLEKPQRCGCGSRKFSFDPKETKFTDIQWLKLQERPEELPPGQMPHSFRVELLGDLCDSVTPGDRVKVTGIIDVLQKSKSTPSRTLNIYMKANHVETASRDLVALEITERDIEKFRELSKDPWIHRRILQSIAPSIYGHDVLKEAIAYLLFGGVAKELPDIRIRGDINVLFVGDPGTGKSQLLQYTAKTAPRGIYTHGRGSTAAGLTAAVVKEESGFVLEAGALVLADMGVCCIDELEKMRPEDRGAIHPAMEQQIVSVAKGGIVAELNSRTSILAAANPTFGRYNPYVTIAQNISELAVTLLNRFDLIFVIRDLPEQQRDSQMAKHILGLHTAGTATPPIDPVTLRKYITYAKRINPSITPEATTRLETFYLKMREASIEGGEASAISITSRQLESLVRISEARARAHLGDEVTQEDAEAAIALMQRSLEQVGIDTETGEYDIDLLLSGKPRSLQMQLQRVLNEISEIERVAGNVKDEDLFDALLQDQGIGRDEAARIIGVLMRDGTIYSPRPGYYRKT